MSIINFACGELHMGPHLNCHGVSFRNNSEEVLSSYIGVW